MNLLQGVLLTLKTTVKLHWNAGFDAFTGPAISPAVKAEIRQVLLKSVPWPNLRIRVLAANLIGLLASVEYPDEWPDLLESVTALFRENDANAVDGAILVVKDLVSDSLSGAEFFRYGIALMDVLRECVSSQELLTSTRTNAVECYKSSIQFFLMVDEQHKLQMYDYVRKNVLQWTALFIQILASPNPSGANADEVGILVLKKTILETLVEMESAFVEFMTDLESVLTVSIDLLQSVCSAARSLDNEPQELIDLIVATFSCIQSCIDSEATQPSTNLYANEAELKRLITCLVVLSRRETPPVETFVSDEMELSVEKSVRAEAGALIASFKSPVVFSLVLSAGFADNSLDNFESTMFLLGEILTQADVSKQVIEAPAIDTIIRICTVGLKDRKYDEQLTSRTIVLASLVSIHLTNRIDKALKQDLFDASVQLGIEINSPLVKAACLLASNRLYALRFELDRSKHRQALFDMILYLVPDASEDTPTFLVESLLSILNMDFSIATESPVPIELLFTLVSKDTSNIELTGVVSDTLGEIVKYASSHDRFAKVCDIAVPPIVAGLQSAAEYSPDRALAFELINRIIAAGPASLLESFVNFILEPFYNAIMQTDDDALLLTASEGFVVLIEKAKEQFKTEQRLNIIMDVTERLLGPQTGDSALTFAGLLINTLIQYYGAELHEQIPKILQVAIQRLNISKDYFVLDELLNVFCGLFNKSLQDTVDLLMNMEVDRKTGLHALLNYWLNNFDILRDIKVIDGSCKVFMDLYSLRPLLDDMFVDGDWVLPDPDMIVTRSKAKNCECKKREFATYTGYLTSETRADFFAVKDCQGIT